VAVSFRIDVITETQRPTLRLAGRLTAEAVGELLRAVTAAPPDAVLDLAEVQWVDPVVGSLPLR